MKELSLAEQLDIFRRVQAVWASCPNEYVTPLPKNFCRRQRTQLCIARRQAARRFTKLAGKYITDNELRRQMRLNPQEQSAIRGWLGRIFGRKPA